MKPTGNIRLNTIPIKKAVVDPKKGLILRTYYVNPQKFLDALMKQKLKRAQVYIVKPAQDIQSVLKTKNILHLKRRFGDENVWKIIVTRNIESKVLPVTLPKVELQHFGISILNFITTLEKSYLTKAKKHAKQLQVHVLNISEKITKAKRVRTKVKVKEQVLSNKNTFTDVLLLDGAKVSRKIELLSIKNPKYAGLRISRVLNLLNPVTPKLVSFLGSLVDKQFNDSTNIVKNITFLPYHVTKEPEFFKPFLINMILDCEQKLYSGNMEDVSEQNLIYYYMLLLKIDKSAFNSMILDFNRFEIKKFATSKESFVDLYMKYKSTPFYLSLLLFYPDINQIVKYLTNENLTVSTKFNILTYLSARDDITLSFLQKLYQLLFKDVTVRSILLSWLRYLTAQQDTLQAPEVLYQVVFASLLRIPYLPFELIDDVEPLNNPFALTLVTKLSKVTKLLRTEIINYLKQNYRKETIKCYIPVRDLPSQQTHVASRLLPLQLGVLSTDELREISNVDFVEVTVKNYSRVNENCVVFTPFDID